MKRLATAIEAYEAATNETERTQVWLAYFREATDPESAVRALVAPWPNRVRRSSLVEAIRTRSGLPEWLFADTLRMAGDPSDGLGLLLGPTSGARALGIREGLEVLWSAPFSLDAALDVLAALEPRERRAFVKRLLGGRLAVGIEHLAGALAQVWSEPRVLVAKWLLERERPDRGWIGFEAVEREVFGPFPFARIESGPGDSKGLAADYLWPGRRVQVVWDGDGFSCWDEDLVPVRVVSGAICEALRRMPPDTVIEAVVSPDGRDWVATDALMEAGRDLRSLPLRERRASLRTLVRPPVRCAELLEGEGEPVAWRQGARAAGACGIVLKCPESTYGGRPYWRAWSSEPVTIRAVLLYAQRVGARFELPTFGVWSEATPLPIAKTGEGLTEPERDLLDRYVRSNAIERSGPVLAVLPEWVYEIAIEQAWPSSRHRSGLKIDRARVLRRLEDAAPNEADTLSSVRRRLGLPD